MEDNTDRLVIYVPGELTLRTIVRNGIAAYTEGQTAEECMAGIPGAVCVPYDAALGMIYKTECAEYIKPFEEITKAEYMEALGCLPPEKWETVHGVNIFRMCEYYTSDITSHYARYQGRFFCAKRRTTAEYKSIAEEVVTEFVRLIEAEVSKPMLGLFIWGN